MGTDTSDWRVDDRALARLALGFLDLTELGDAAAAQDVALLCDKAQGHVPQRPHLRLPEVAAVCVWPQFVAQARQALPARIRVAAVVNFPTGEQSAQTVRQQVQQIRSGGGQEVDCVLPYRAWMAGETDRARDLVRAVRQESVGLTLKLILESGVWDNGADLRADLRAACDMALAEGVDFLKTSTGKVPQGASVAAADVLLAALAAHPDHKRLGFKPSGGIRNVADVRPYALAVERHLGADALVAERFRIGASGLWTHIANLLDAADPGETPAPGAEDY